MPPKKDDTMAEIGRDLTQYGLVPQYLIQIKPFYEWVVSGDLVIDGDPELLLRALQTGVVYAANYSFDAYRLIEGIRLNIGQDGSIVLKGEALKGLFMYHLNSFEMLARDDMKSDALVWSRYIVMGLIGNGPLLQAYLDCHIDMIRILNQHRPALFDRLQKINKGLEDFLKSTG